MAERELAVAISAGPHFESVPPSLDTHDDGTREMGELYPFLISGGKNTERYYFTHINDTTDYKFNIRPRYFGDESSYVESFPKRIREVLAANNDAVVFCVFDWDTVYDNETRLRSHEAFEEQFKDEIESGVVVLCPSMPSIEYWFLLHFVNYDDFLKDYPAISNVLAPYLRPCFPPGSPSLKKLLKGKKYLSDATWVKNLCSDGKLDMAIERAKKNIEESVKDGSLEGKSYSFVYKVFL